jgi:hypothetical protein
VCITAPLSLTHAHSDQVINDDELPRRPAGALPLQWKDKRSGKVFSCPTVYKKVVPSSRNKWVAWWHDNTTRHKKGGFETDLAAARHAAARHAAPRVGRRPAVRLDTLTTTYDAETYVS